MDNNNQQQQVKIEIPKDVAQGHYANLAMITHSSSDIVLDFAQMMPGTPPMVCSRVIMAPEHAKRFLFALQENIAKYEQSFGKIVLPEKASRTIAPFGTPKSEA